MVTNRGTWAIWSRGQNPNALTQWEEVTKHETNSTLEEVLPAFILMKNQGQHVRLEWMPKNAYGQEFKSNPDADHSEAIERERKNWYPDNPQAEVELDSMRLGYGYI